MTEASKFQDLTTRILSAVVLLAIAGGALYASGVWFIVFCSVLAGLCVWELCRFSSVEAIKVIPIGFFAAATVAALHFGFTVSVVGFATIILMFYCLYIGGKDAFLRLFYLALIILGCWGVLNLHQMGGLILTLWLIVCVVSSDIGGYFFGRIFGGPKLWPAVSPKKTWSGTIGGWVLAVLFSAIGFVYFEVNMIFLLLAVAVAIAAQAGDLFESWLKRRAGVKDSSNLIPGHGGFLDRFDGFIGAGVLVMLIDQLKFIWL